MHADAVNVLKFWFEELKPAQWWKVDAKLDQEISSRFGELLRSTCAGESFDWRNEPEGRLAEVIVIDQFSRNVHRGTPLAFQYDSVALVLAQEAVIHGYDKQIPVERRAFLYMPYMHSESIQIQNKSLELFSQPGLEGNMKSANSHFSLIERFGRYPHRNEILGRSNTQAEAEFLAAGGSYS